MSAAGRPTRRSLASDLAELGLAAGDAVLVHAGLRSVGQIVGGPDSLIDALRDVLGPSGTLLANADWQGEAEILSDPVLRAEAPPFDPARSRAARENGAFPELLRTTPGALRSASPGASCVALGGRARWFVDGHALDYGYGERSPFARLVEAGGKTLLVGAPLDTITLLHHAEHRADIAGKRVIRYCVPLLENGRTIWREIEEFDTADPVVEGLPDDYFAAIVGEFLSAGAGSRGLVGRAPAVLVEAGPIVRFATEWLEARFPPMQGT